MKRQKQKYIKNVYKYLVPDSTFFGCTICNQGNQDGNEIFWIWNGNIIYQKHKIEKRKPIARVLIYKKWGTQAV